MYDYIYMRRNAGRYRKTREDIERCRKIQEYTGKQYGIVIYDCNQAMVFWYKGTKSQ